MDQIRQKIEGAIRLPSTPTPSPEVVDSVREETLDELRRRARHEALV
jgi:hypothetical protein